MGASNDKLRSQYEQELIAWEGEVTKYSAKLKDVQRCLDDAVEHANDCRRSLRRIEEVTA